MTVWGAGVCRDCPFELELFVLLYILCYKSFPKRLLAHVSLWHLSHWFNVRLISGNDSSLFTWYDLMTLLNVCTHWKNTTGSFKNKSFLWQSWGPEGLGVEISSCHPISRCLRMRMRVVPEMRNTVSEVPRSRSRPPPLCGQA